MGIRLIESQVPHRFKKSVTPKMLMLTFKESDAANAGAELRRRDLGGFAPVTRRWNAGRFPARLSETRMKRSEILVVTSNRFRE